MLESWTFRWQNTQLMDIERDKRDFEMLNVREGRLKLRVWTSSARS